MALKLLNKRNINKLQTLEMCGFLVNKLDSKKSKVNIVKLSRKTVFIKPNNKKIAANLDWSCTLLWR